MSQIPSTDLKERKLQAAESQISQLNQKLKITEDAYLSLKIRLDQI